MSGMRDRSIAMSIQYFLSAAATLRRHLLIYINTKALTSLLSASLPAQLRVL